MKVLRFLAVVILMAFAPAASAQPDPTMEAEAPEAEWQTVVTLQIEAFREGDGLVALSFAGQGFKAAFPNPNDFYSAIFAAGYGPILQSRSHSFGDFQMVGEDAVIQVVKIVGPDQLLYSALYQLAREPDGWRVQGVQLSAEEGIGI